VAVYPVRKEKELAGKGAELSGNGERVECAFIFTALHGMQTRSYDEIYVRLSVRLSVCPSVRLSNACIVTKRKKDMFRFLYHTKEHLS